MDDPVQEPVEAPQETTEAPAPADTPEVPTDPAELQAGYMRHAKFTQSMQELARIRKKFEGFDDEDLEFLRKWKEDESATLREMGYELEEPQYEEYEGDEYDTDVDDPNERIARIEQRLVENDLRLHIGTELAAIEQEHGKLDEQEQDWIVRRALQLNPGQRPDIRGAHKEFLEIVTERVKAAAEAERQGYIDSKDAPPPPPGGKGGSSVPDLDDREARLKIMASKMAAGSDQ